MIGSQNFSSRRISLPGLLRRTCDGGVGWDEPVQLAVLVIDLPTIEGDVENAVLLVDASDGAEIAVEHLLIVVVLGLHDLVAGQEDGAEPLHPGWRVRVQRLLEGRVQSAGAERAPLHGQRTWCRGQGPARNAGGAGRARSRPPSPPHPRDPGTRRNRSRSRFRAGATPASRPD